jgi:Outer membrane protein beta-barrel domain
MRHVVAGFLISTLLLATPSVASAQERVPHSGSTAVGVDVGLFAPTADQFDPSMVMNVLYEYYVTPRVSLRSGFGWANPSFKGGALDSLRQIPLRLDVNYNWEGGRWHPFVGSGVGAYFLQFQQNGQTLGETDATFGLNAGGGVEYFFTRNATIKGEGRYHAINDSRGQDPSGLVFTIGLKTYF